MLGKKRGKREASTVAVRRIGSKDRKQNNYKLFFDLSSCTANNVPPFRFTDEIRWGKRTEFFNNQHNLTTRNDLPIICKPGWSFSATWMAERNLKRRIPANPACLKLLLYNYTLPFQQTRILKISVADPNPGWFFAGSRRPNPYFWDLSDKFLGQKLQ